MAVAEDEESGPATAGGDGQWVPGGKLFDILGKIPQHLEIFPTRVIAAYNFIVGIVVFGVLRCAGRLRKDKVKN